MLWPLVQSIWTLSVVLFRRNMPDMGFCAGGALALYAWRAPLFRSNAGFAPISRESFLLLNNVLLVAATALILIGTLYPMFLDAFNLRKISVGPPYFSVAFLIPMLPLLLLLARGMHASWKRASQETAGISVSAAPGKSAIVRQSTAKLERGDEHGF